MEDAVTLLQQILKGINMTDVANATTIPEQTSALATSLEAILPASLVSFIPLLFSFSALGDWLKLFLIGGVFETCRRLGMSAYQYCMGCFFINAYFEEDDESYQWIMFWLSRHWPRKRARNVEITTRSFGLNESNGYDSDDDCNSGNDRKISLIPSMSTSYNLWYKWRRVTVTRTERQKGYYGRTEETLTITIMAWSQDILLELLQEARREYFAAQVNDISIYYSDSSNNWRLACTRPKRPISSIVLDPGIKDLILDDARDFLDSRAWYAARGLPFRRGFLLYGAPGSGKTSVIHALAGELGLNVYVISLSRLGLDDTSLSEIITELPPKCIALMEDIDAAFHHGLNREPDVVQPPGEDGSTPPPSKPAEAPSTSSRITLSGLLNALDGIGAQEGRILFATTNKYHSLDPALCRPGRMDVHVEFKLASKYQARELYRRFFLPDELPEDVGIVDALGPEKKTLSDSGYNSRSSSVVDLSTATSQSETTPLLPKSEQQPHGARGPQLSPDEVDKLAEQFAEAIPEREHSMASLQGYLMMYKIRPRQAVTNISTWIVKEKREREEKMRLKMGVAPKPEA